MNRLEAAYRSTLKTAGVTIHDTRAVVEDAHTVRLATGERFTARAHPDRHRRARPSCPNSGVRSWRSPRTRCSTCRRCRKRALVVGGGYIASEFACILNGLGVKVAQYYRGAQILRGFDDEARGHVAEAMAANGIAIHCGTDVMRLEKTRGRHPRRGDRRHPNANSIWCCMPPGAGPIRTGWGWRRWAWNLARRGRSWWMTTARPPCPRSMRWAM